MEKAVSDLQILVGDAASVEFRPSARSGKGGKLGTIDPGTWDIIIHLLDTQAAAAAVQTVLGGVGGYLFAKTGKKHVAQANPDPETKE